MRKTVLKLAIIVGLAAGGTALAATSTLADTADVADVVSAPAAESLELPVLLMTGVGTATSEAIGTDALAMVGAVDANASPGAVLDEAIAAQRNGQNRAAAVFLLMALVGAVRLVWKTSQEKKWLGWALNYATAYLATIGAVFATGASFSLSVALNAFVTALAAAGGWEQLKDSGLLNLLTKKKG